MKAILIARVSTEEQRDAGNSLPAQIARLERYCSNKNLNIVEVFSFDESAYKETRDTFDKVINTILSYKEKIAVCCDKVDRLTRNMFDKRVSLLYEKSLNDELELHFISDGQILNSKLSASEKFQFSISLGLAKYYSDAVSDNVKRAMEQKLRNGEWIAKAPYGYRNVKDSAGKSDVIIEEYESLIVQKMFELYSSGLYSIDLLIDKIKKDHGVEIFAGNVGRILGNPFYYGEMRVSNKLYPHKYPAVISKDIFDKVQDLKDNYNKKKMRFKSTKTRSFLYRGLMQCAHCKLRITVEEHKSKYTYYHCTEWKAKHNAKWIREEKVNEVIESVFQKLQIPQHIAHQITETLNELNKHEIEFHEQQIKKLEQKQNTIQKMMDNLYLDKLKGSITEHDYDKYFEKFKLEQTEINQRLTQLQDDDNNYIMSSRYIISILSDVYDLFKSSKVEQKRHLIKFVFSNLEIEGENVVYKLQKPFDTILEYSDSIIWRQTLGTLRNFNWQKLKENFNAFTI